MSKKTLAALEKAAMRWARQYGNYLYPRAWGRKHETTLARACVAHAKSVKGKR